MLNYKCQAIVLHSVKYGDSSLIVYLYTKDYGRKTYILNGLRSAKSKGNKAALIQPMMLVEIEAAQAPHAEMHRIREIANMTPTNPLFDPGKSTISLFMAEAVYRLVREQERNEPLFDFLSTSVRRLSVMNDGVANFHLWFMVRLSAFMGFYPDDNYTPDTFFDIKSGNFVIIPPLHRMSFNREQSRILWQLINCEEADGLSEIKLSRQSRSEFLNAMLNFIGFHTDSIFNVKSIDILREVF